MLKANNHENNLAYHSFPHEVPADLFHYYQQVKPGFWAYVCPCCKYIYAPKWAGMPNSFRAHVSEYLAGKGCFFNPSNKTITTSKKHSPKTQDY